MEAFLFGEPGTSWALLSLWGGLFSKPSQLAAAGATVLYSPPRRVARALRDLGQAVAVVHDINVFRSLLEAYHHNGIPPFWPLLAL